MTTISATQALAEKLEYRVYSDLSSIGALLHDWHGLLQTSACNRAFASPEWYQASCHMGRYVPHLIVGMKNEAVECILPLVRDPDGTARFPHFGNDYNDVLVRNDDPATTAEALIYAASFPDACSRLLLSRLRPDSNCLRALHLISAVSSIECHCREINSFLCIDLPGNFEEYLLTRSKAFRKNIRRAFRKVEGDGLVVQELLPGLFDAAQLPELFILLSRSRHKEKSFLQHEDACSFIRSVLPALFRKRALRAFALVRGEQVLALDLCTVRSCGFVTWNGGFLNEAAGWSPGTLLFAFGIQRAIEMDLDEYDFTEGKEAYKCNWANSQYVVTELTIISKAENRVSPMKLC
ncbi:MAG TPA: GNAT family N-acetyltransferase [Candidatus Angelobacter sp.]|jgi:CelD/BcsL family acetyltransferase involved in cellulose biosynthesis|nr:GNAT family N-acetyltransferase [Candidatus Angelobacter sp.]